LPDARFIDKPWGFKEILVQTNSYTLSRLHIEKWERLSLQKHPDKIETLIVENNYCLIYVDGKIRVYGHGEFIHIPILTIHRIEAIDIDCDVLEVATLPGDEVIRIEDDYGR